MSTILSEIEAFLTAHNMKHTRFGQLSRGDKHLVKQLRAGRRMWPENEAKVRHFMATYRPEHHQMAA